MLKPLFVGLSLLGILCTPLMALDIIKSDISNKRIDITFDTPLTPHQGNVKGFEVADKRYGRFIPAVATVNGANVTLHYESYASSKEQQAYVVWRYTSPATSAQKHQTLQSYNGTIPFHAVPLGKFPAVGKVLIACVGDSITHGSNIKDENQRYPETLGRLLGPRFCVGRFGNNGKTAGKYRNKSWFGFQKEFTQSLQFQADVYICNLGINDPNPKSSEAGFSSLIRSFQGPQQARVILWSKLGPDFRGIPGKKAYPGNIFEGYNFQTRDNGTSHNRVIMEQLIAKLARKYHCPTMDAYTEMAKDPELYKVDGLHPTAEGAAKLARLTYQFLAQFYSLP